MESTADENELKNPDLREAATRLVSSLRALSVDALVIRSIPAYDPEAEPFAGPVEEVEGLQAFYLPHRQLPSPGQELWRDLQGLIDLRVCDSSSENSPAAELVRFHKAIDAFQAWVVRRYQLQVAVPDKGKPGLTTNEADREDREAVWQMILELLVRQSAAPNENFPSSQAGLAKVLGRSQGFVSKLFSTFGEERGLDWETFRQAAFGRKADEAKKGFDLGTGKEGGTKRFNRDLEAIDPHSGPSEEGEE